MLQWWPRRITSVNAGATLSKGRWQRQDNIAGNNAGGAITRTTGAEATRDQAVAQGYSVWG